MRELEGQPLHIRLEGEFDMSGVERLNRLLRPLERGGDAVVDMTGVRYLDSTALACLVHAAKRRDKDASKVVLQGPSLHVRRVLTIAKLDSFFSVVD